MDIWLNVIFVFQRRSKSGQNRVFNKGQKMSCSNIMFDTYYDAVFQPYILVEKS